MLKRAVRRSLILPDAGLETRLNAARLPDLRRQNVHRVRDQRTGDHGDEIHDLLQTMERSSL